MSNIPEHVKHLLPEFDLDRYEYAAGPAEEWGDCDCEWWHNFQWYKTKTTPVGRGERSIYRRPRERYLSIEPEEARKGDERLCIHGTTPLREWVRFVDEFDHATKMFGTYRRRIEQ